jgi:hypothetical protein
MIYNCNFQPSMDNGHWHESQAEAERCVDSWNKWNSVVPSKMWKYPNFSYKPHSRNPQDRNF